MSADLTPSVLHYLSSLIPHGHVPQQIGTAQIGRTIYAAGSFVTLPRCITPGCRAYAEGHRWTDADLRWALTPIYRTDWVARESCGPTPSLLPASYTRSPNKTIFADHERTYYVAGYSRLESPTPFLWLHDASWMADNPWDADRREHPISFRWDMPYADAYRTARQDIKAACADLARGAAR